MFGTMSASATSMRVIVEPSVMKARGKSQIFRYTRAKGRKKGKLVSDPQPLHRGERTVRVLSIASRGDVKKLSASRENTVAVTSPKIFNEPSLRTKLSESRAEVYIHGEGALDMDDITPWLDRFFPSQEKEEEESFSAPTEADILAAKLNVLSLAKRLRHPKTGRLDARAISELLGISMSDIATKVCGVSKQSLNQSPSSAGVQEKLQVLEEIAGLLHWCGGDEEKLRAWINRPNRDIAKYKGKTLSPLDMILLGHAEIVSGMVWNLRTGHPS